MNHILKKCIFYFQNYFLFYLFLLFEPDTNIKYGCWYLGYLIHRFNGNLTCAIAAYHAGQGTVDGWLANPEYSPNGTTLQTIPSSATDTYVKRVLKYYEKYKELYTPSAA